MRIVKAYFDIKYKNCENYVHNYNDYETVAEIRNFLFSRGRLNPTGAYTNELVLQLAKEPNFGRRTQID